MPANILQIIYLMTSGDRGLGLRTFCCVRRLQIGALHAYLLLVLQQGQKAAIQEGLENKRAWIAVRHCYLLVSRPSLRERFIYNI